MRYHHILLIPPALGTSLDEIWVPQRRWTPPPEGTCNSAVDVMTFHRDKMNEYLCREYLAYEILAAENGEDVLEDRAGVALKEDEGSLGYQDWLARSTTLEDIYKHYEQETSEDAPVGAAALPTDFDGDVTGYAMLGNRDAPVGDSSGYGVGTSYGAPEYGGGVSKASGGSDKGMKLQDLFQLALTAIAFLAFGTFFTEVIMCVMDLKALKSTQAPTLLMMEPLQQGAQGMSYYKTEEPEIPENYQKEEIFLPHEPMEYVRINEPSRSSRKSRASENYVERLAGKALATLEGLENSHRDGGKRLRRALCEANKFSTSLTGSKRIWLPLWSFGMSWIGGRHISKTIDSPFGALKFLTASVQGFAGINCNNID